MRFGYIRVSSEDQNEARQVDALDGFKLDEVFTDKVSGAKMDRKDWNRLYAMLRPGDEIYIKSIDRLSRSTMDFLSTWKDLSNKGVKLVVKDLGLTLDKENSMTEFIVTVMAAAAQLERGQIRQRQREGYEAAKARNGGVVKGRGESKRITQAKDELRGLLDREFTDAERMKLMGVSRATYYKLKKELAAQDCAKSANAKN